VRRAIQAPARQIVQNAGEDGSLVVGKLLEKADYLGLQCRDRRVPGPGHAPA
jgi:chaperonin GroEL (HSP60 family)